MRCGPEQPAKATTPAHTATRHTFMHGTLPHNPAAMHEPVFVRVDEPFHAAIRGLPTSRSAGASMPGKAVHHAGVGLRLVNLRLAPMLQEILQTGPAVSGE